VNCETSIKTYGKRAKGSRARVLKLTVFTCKNAIFFPVRMIKERADELELKVGLLKIINHRLESPLKSSCRVSSKQNRSSYRNSASRVSPGSFLLFDQSNHPSRSNFMPSLTLEQLTDTAFLTKKLADLKSKVTQVKHENETRFVPKETKGQLFNRLQEREVVKEALLTKREELKMKIVATKLSLAVWENIRKPSLKAQSSIVGKIAVALRETNRTMEKADEISEEKTEELQPDRKEKQYAYTEEEGNQRSALSSRMIAEDDDPTKDREAEFILEYIENFFEVGTCMDCEISTIIIHQIFSPA